MAARSKIALAGLLAAGLQLANMLPAGAATMDRTVRETMGAPVYASDGHEVGKVIDVSVSDDGEIHAVHIKTGSFLGFGQHVLALPKGSFTVLRGAVVVDLPTEALETLRPVPADK